MPSDRLPFDRVYWDSCVFIDHLQGDKPDRAEVVDGLIKLARAGKLLIVTSSLTIAEVIRWPGDAEERRDQDELSLIHAFFEHEWIGVRAVDRIIAQRAAGLRVRFKLKTADAVHLATAHLSGVPILQTYDHQLIKLNGDPALPSIAITQPSHPEKRPLFE